MAGQTSEVEETLKRLQGHKGVIGVVIVNQDGIPIRTTFDQAVTVQYAGLITQLCSKARSAVRELDPQVRPPAQACARANDSCCTVTCIFDIDSVLPRMPVSAPLSAPGCPCPHLCPRLCQRRVR